MKKINIILCAIVLSVSACSDWLDVVPDGVATLDMAFNSRTQALKYLSTCYSYMPKNGGVRRPRHPGGRRYMDSKYDPLLQPFLARRARYQRGKTECHQPRIIEMGRYVPSLACL